MSDSSKPSQKAYAAAGVDIDAASRMLGDAKADLKAATRREVMGAVGGFGGLFDMSELGYDKPVLVSSTDGVGTKVMLAHKSGMHGGIGYDIVNHCCNDVAVVGAEPLFFLDYYATGKLDGKAYRDVLSSLARACMASNVALIGGETAEMPGLYDGGEYDLVGTIVGVAEKTRLLSGTPIQPGDQIIGLASSGLHTNGYSLARKIFFEDLGLSLEGPLPGTQTSNVCSVAEALLAPHVNYSQALRSALAQFNQGDSFEVREGNQLFAAAHITGGGFTGNIPRILPDTVDAVISTERWPSLPVFNVLAQHGNVDKAELYEVFNMGIGLCLIVAPEAAETIRQYCEAAGHPSYLIGEIVAGEGKVQLQ